MEAEGDLFQVRKRVILAMISLSNNKWKLTNIPNEMEAGQIIILFMEAAFNKFLLSYKAVLSPIEERTQTLESDRPASISSSAISIKMCTWEN